MWLGVAIGMGSVITAAMRAQEAGVCKGYDIRIEGFKKDMLFTSEDRIAALLKAATRGNITGQRKSEFNLQVIEDLLEQSAWVYNADLYFDNNDVLHANVTERKPLARIFTSMGASFYIDEAGRHIPLSDKISLDLPVFTGYAAKKIMSSADSILMQNIIATASFISNDSFWNAQVAQIDINNCGAGCWNMEMIPVIGSHKVDLGDGTDIVSKFHRLYLFYDQVLKRTGFDKYQKIDVQYNGQVIGVKGHYTKVDSIQLRKNIEHLLQQSRAYNEMVQIAPVVSYTSMPKGDTTLSADEIYGAIEPADSTLFMNDSEDRPEVEVKKENTGVVPADKKPVSLKPAKPVVKAEAKEPKASDKKTTRPPAAVKPAAAGTSEKKRVSVKKTEKKTEVKKTDKKSSSVIKKTETKKTTSSKTTVKAEAKKPAVKKAEEREVKRNVLLKPDPAKKTVEKTTPGRKKDPGKNG
ncbi:hypothetical protein GCM10027516_40770 [Niabella aquatica]